MGSPRVVFDTNVLVSGFGFGGKPDECISLALSGEIELVLSTDVLHELAIVVEYDRLPFSAEEGHEFAGLIEDAARIVEPTHSIDAVDADPEDDKFLECAVVADADYVISGDNDLLKLDSYRGVEIVPPADFLEVHAKG